MNDAGGARQGAHQLSRATGMVKMNMREKQEVHLVGRKLQLPSAASINGTAVLGPVSMTAARPPDTTMCAASIWGRTYSVSTAVMPFSNIVSRGMTAFMACGNIAA
jgi:hypothetical protein